MAAPKLRTPADATIAAICLHCGRPLARRHPSQKFCSPIRGSRICKDAFNNSRREVVIVNGVAAPAGYVGLSDHEEDEVRHSSERDDF